MIRSCISSRALSTKAKPTPRRRPPIAALPSRKPEPFLAPALPRLIPEIVHEDAKLCVLNKPSNVAIQGQHGTPARRRWDDLIGGELALPFRFLLCPHCVRLCVDLKARPTSPEIFPVHRLDKVCCSLRGFPLKLIPPSLLPPVHNGLPSLRKVARTGKIFLLKPPHTLAGRSWRAYKSPRCH